MSTRSRDATRATLQLSGAVSSPAGTPEAEEADLVIDRPECDTCGMAHRLSDICLGPTGPNASALGWLTAGFASASNAEGFSTDWTSLGRRELRDYDARLERGMDCAREAISMLTARGVLSASLTSTQQEDIACSACLLLSGCQATAAGSPALSPSLPMRISSFNREYRREHVQLGTAAVGEVTRAIPTVVYLLLQWLPSGFTTHSNPTTLEWHIARRCCRGGASSIVHLRN